MKTQKQKIHFWYICIVFSIFHVVSKEFKISKVFQTHLTFHASFLKSVIFLVESTLILLIFQKTKHKNKKNQNFKKIKKLRDQYVCGHATLLLQILVYTTHTEGEILKKPRERQGNPKPKSISTSPSSSHSPDLPFSHCSPSKPQDNHHRLPFPLTAPISTNLPSHPFFSTNRFPGPYTPTHNSLFSSNLPHFPTLHWPIHSRWPNTTGNHLTLFPSQICPPLTLLLSLADLHPKDPQPLLSSLDWTQR